MNRERLEEIKRNSTDVYKYMDNVRKEYLNGKTIIDQRIFVHKFKENHSQEEVIYFFNEMKGHKESNISFTNGFLGIILPIYVAIFTFIGLLFSSIINFAGNLSEKGIDLKLENKDTNFDDAIDLFTQTGSIITASFGSAILLVLAFLLIIYWFRHRNTTKRMQYLSWLNTVKDINVNDIKSK